jgi:hypothetical protein
MAFSATLRFSEFPRCTFCDPRKELQRPAATARTLVAELTTKQWQRASASAELGLAAYASHRGSTEPDVLCGI